MPQTYILEMLRRAMLRAEPLGKLLDLVVPLGVSALLTLSVGYVVYVKSIEYAKEHGTVEEY